MNKNQPYKEFPGFPPEPIRNYWEYPRVMNGYWHALTGSEQKVLDYILRHTWGYKKTADFISYSQFIKGIVKKSGEILDLGCGVKSTKTLRKALRGLEEKGFIRSTKNSGRTIFYELRINGVGAKSKAPWEKVKTSMGGSKEVGVGESKDTIRDITIEDSQQINEWIKKYGDGIPNLISKHGFNQVRDSIRITESKLGRVQSPIAFITRLCQNGARWDDTEEAKEEKHLRSLKEDTDKLLKEAREADQIKAERRKITGNPIKNGRKMEKNGIPRRGRDRF